MSLANKRSFGSTPQAPQQAYDSRASEFIPNNSGYVQTNDDGVQSSPTKGGAKGRRDQPLLPCTILQILQATQQNQDDDDFIIDGRPVNYISIVGQILSSQPHPTNITYVIDDATAQIEVRVWVDHNNPDDYIYQRSTTIHDSDYVKVIGSIRALGNKRSIIGSDVDRVSDFNQLTYHQLDVIHTHLYNIHQQQPVGGVNYQPNYAENQPTSNIQDYQQPQMQMDAGLNQLQSALVQFIAEASKTEGGQGVHISTLFEWLSEWPQEEIRNTLYGMTDEGHLYTTVDTEHFAVTDY